MKIKIVMFSELSERNNWCESDFVNKLEIPRLKKLHSKAKILESQGKIKSSIKNNH